MFITFLSSYDLCVNFSLLLVHPFSFLLLLSLFAVSRVFCPCSGFDQILMFMIVQKNPPCLHIKEKVAFFRFLKMYRRSLNDVHCLLWIYSFLLNFPCTEPELLGFGTSIIIRFTCRTFDYFRSSFPKKWKRILQTIETSTGNTENISLTSYLSIGQDRL